MDVGNMGSKDYLAHQKLEQKIKSLEQKIKSLEQLVESWCGAEDGEVVLNRRRGNKDRRTEKARMFRQWMWTGASIGSGVSCRRGNYDAENKDVDF